MNILEDIHSHPILGMFPKLIIVMLATYSAFKVLDFTTGLLKTWKGVSKYRSPVMRNGIITWIGELVAITFVFIIDIVVGLDFYLTGFTLSLFIYKECGSILENLQAIGVDIKDLVSPVIESFNKFSKGGK